MKRVVLVAVPGLLAALMLQSPALAAGTFRDVDLEMSGPNLLVTFRETGLVPGQNYAYLASGSAMETFQCYRDRTSTPTKRTETVSGPAGEDPRVYTANDRGVVKGFVFLSPGFPWPDFCPAHQSVVPVRACYQPRDLLDFAEWNVYWFQESLDICGPIEPD